MTPSRTGLPCIAAALLIVCLAFVAVAHGQTSLSVGTPLTGREPADIRCGHGWLVVAGPAGGGRAASLVHIPPRDGGDYTRSGTFRVVLPLELVPTALGAWEERVWIVFKPSPSRRADAPEARERRVASAWASRTVIGTWEYQPEVGAEAVASLPGEGELAGFVGTAAGPLAVIHDPARSPSNRWQVLLLSRGQWKPLDAPPFLRAAADTGSVRLVATPDGPALIRRTTGGHIDVWKAAVRPGESPTLTWAERPALVTRSDDPVVALSWTPADSAAWCDGQIVLVREATGGAEIRVVRPAGVWPLAAYTGAPESSPLVVPLDGLGRIALAWPESEAGAARGRQPTSTAALKFRWAEVSVFSGRQVASVDAKREGLLSPRDFQLLTLIFAALMMAVLLFVLRSDQRAEPLIPRGTSLATPGRRVIAAAIDAAFAYFAACAAAGVSPGRVFAPASLLSPGVVLTVIGLTMLIGIAHAGVAEWLTGRSVGKAITACRVVRLGTIDEPAAIIRPRFWQAMARNVVRWVFPPLGMLMVFDRTFRHPGDVLARTIVIQDFPSDEDPPDDVSSPD